MASTQQRSGASIAVVMALFTVTVVLHLAPTVHSKAIYVKLLDQDSYPLVVRIRENYSKVNAVKTPSSNQVTVSTRPPLDQVINDDNSNGDDDEEEVASDATAETVTTFQDEGIALPSPAPLIASPPEEAASAAVAADYQEHSARLETASTSSVEELPEDFMRKKISAIMRSREEMAQFLQSVALDLNANYGGYVVQYLPSKGARNENILT